MISPEELDELRKECEKRTEKLMPKLEKAIDEAWIKNGMEQNYELWEKYGKYDDDNL